jgi:hypothetical protein
LPNSSGDDVGVVRAPRLDTVKMQIGRTAPDPCSFFEHFCNKQFSREHTSLCPEYGMVKSYNKYELSESFGLVTSGIANVIAVSDQARSAGPGIAIVGANEAVLSWDLKKGELVGIWKDRDCTAKTTSLARSVTDPDIFAAGYVRDKHHLC